MFDRTGNLTFVALAAVLALAPNAVAQTTWYVDDDAPGDPGPGDPTISDPLEDGSAEHPFDAIQEGIDAAGDGDEVVVADGTYTGLGNRDIDYFGKAITVRSDNGPGDCIVDCQGGSGDWHRGFHFQSGEGAASVLDGLTITNGYTDQAAGIYCVGASPTIVNCVVTGNDSSCEYYCLGGGICCFDSDSLIANCTITDNWAVVGAGIHSEGGNPTITECTITENRGFGITCDGGSITNCTITKNNQFKEAAGGIYCFGGTPAIANCLITDHSGYDSGVGIYCEHSDPTISNCTIARNAASWLNGGIRCYQSSPVVTDCVIAENEAGYWPGTGVICEHGSDAVLVNCTIARNWAWWGGGGVYVAGSSPAFFNCTITENGTDIEGGGGILIDGGTATVVNCAITNNGAEYGGGIGFHSGSASISNSIIWENAPDEIDASSGSIEVTYCDVLGGWPGEGNIDADPELIRDGIHLRRSSPCIGAGDPNGDYSDLVDIDSEPRLSGERVDIGPDEFHDQDDDGLPDWWEQVYFGSPTAADPSGDEDADGLVNSEEYARCRNPLRAPVRFYVSIDGDDAWDGLAPAWDGVHGPKATIQAAIDEADSYENDEVTVGDGTYMGNGNRAIRFHRKALTVRSANGPANCIVDCENADRGFYFDRYESADSVLDSLTVRRGFTSWAGGGIYCFRSSPTIRGCIISGNTADDHGGGIYCEHADPLVVECVIMGNAVQYVNYFDASGAGAHCERGNPTFIDCLITANTSCRHGGGISCSRSHLRVVNCTVAENLANDSGGGFYWWNQSNPELVSCAILGNVTGGEGGGIHGMHDFTLVGCTIVGNSASVGGGAYTEYGYPLILSSIFWQNTPQQIARANGTPTVGYCDVQGGWPGEGNINADPLFVDPDGPDDDPNTWEDNDYHLLGDSPCIDAGDNESVPEWVTTDLDGRLRFADRIGTPDSGNGTAPIVDMGAYEYQCDGDLDGDGEIGLPDLATLLSSYGMNTGATYADGDIDQDGGVDLSDLAVLLSVYGTTCE